MRFTYDRINGALIRNDWFSSRKRMHSKRKKRFLLGNLAILCDQFSRKLAIFRPISFFGNQTKMDQKLRVLRVFPVLRVSAKIASFRILGPPVGGNWMSKRLSKRLIFGNWTFLEIVKFERRNGCEKSFNSKKGVAFSWSYIDSLLKSWSFLLNAR